MLSKITNWLFENKNKKWFKITVVAIFIVAVITINSVNKDDESGKAESSSIAENTDNAETDNKSGFHVDIGHFIMLGVFTAAYGIDRIIVYRNKLEDDKKYDNHREE